MSRKTASHGDSLDLLLDTMCDTLGGILFICMLVAILTNQAIRDTAPSAPSVESSRELRRMRSELTQSDSRLTKLRQAIRQKEDLERRFADPDSLALLESLRTLDVSSDELLKKRSDTLSEVAESQAVLVETARQLEQLALAMDAAKDRLEIERRKLEEEASLRSRTTQVPRQRATQKRQLLFFLKAGRFCAYAKRDADGNLVHNDVETTEVVEGPGKKFVQPLPGAGLAIAEDGSNSDEIASRLADFDKEQHFLSVFVFKDSFAYFESLKNEVIRSGFEYHLVPFPDEEKVYIGDQTEPVFVQ